MADLIPDMTSYTAPSGVVSASSELGEPTSTRPAWHAFNDTNADANDCWIANGATGWLQYKFESTKVKCNQYTITTRNLAGDADAVLAPRTWTLLASNTGAFGGEETTIDTQTNITDWATTENSKKTFNITLTAAFLYWRLNITVSNGATLVAVGEMEILGELAPEGGAFLLNFI